MDVSKQHRKCYVRSNNRYTCLNSTCLVHSWICMEHPEENRPLIEAHHREAAKTQQPLKLGAKSNNNPGVIDAASDGENSDKIPPTEPPPVYFYINTLRGKKTTKVFCNSGCAHNLIHDTTTESLHDDTAKESSIPPTTKKTLAAQVTDNNTCPNYPHTTPSDLALGAPRAHQHRRNDRPDPEPPDIS